MLLSNDLDAAGGARFFTGEQVFLPPTGSLDSERLRRLRPPSRLFPLLPR